MIDHELALVCLDTTATDWGSTRYAEHARCPKAAWLRYTCGVQRMNDDGGGDRLDAREVGTLFHAARAYTLRGMLLTGVPLPGSDLLDFAAGLKVDGLSRFDPEALAEAQRLVDAYVARWGDDGGWPKVRYVELLLPRTECAWYMLPSGRADLVVEVGGRVVVVDYKTIAALGDGVSNAELAAEYRTRPQFAALCKRLQLVHGLDYIPDLIVDVVVKTKIPKFRRVQVSFEEPIVKLHLRAFEAATRDMRTHSPHVEPCPNLHSCSPRPGQRCWAFAWCHGTAADRELLFTTGATPCNKQKEIDS